MRAVLAILVLAASPALAQPVVQVDGIFTGQTGTQAEPELGFAASQSSMVEIAGTGVSFENFQTLQTQTITTAQFWAGAGITATPSEHRLAFDPRSSRFLVTADDANHRYLAVSISDDVTAGWLGFTLPPGTNPRVVADANAIYVTGTANGATDVIALPINDVLSGNGTTGQHLTPGELDLVPVADRDGDPSAPQLLVARTTAGNGNTAIDIWKIQWTNGIATLAAPVTVDLQAVFRDPPATAVQPSPGPGLSTGTSQVRSAAASSGQLFGIAATQVNGRAGAFVFRIDLSTTSVVSVDQIGADSEDLIDPELAVDANFDIGIVGVVTGASTPPTVAVTASSSFFGNIYAPLMPVFGTTAAYSCAPQGGVSSYAPHAAISADPFVQRFWADGVVGGTGDCGFSTQPVAFDLFTEGVGDDFFPIDDGGFPSDPVDSKPLAGCCSSSGGGSSVVLSAVVIGLALARRRAARSRRR